MTVWRKPSASGGGNCVEVATPPGMVLVRDSKNPAGPVLAIGPAAWHALLDDIRKARTPEGRQ